MSADERSLYFARLRSGTSKYDVFSADLVRRDGGSFHIEDAAALTPSGALNDPVASNVAGWLSHDACRLYFTTNVLAGELAIHVATRATRR